MARDKAGSPSPPHTSGLRRPHDSSAPPPAGTFVWRRPYRGPIQTRHDSYKSSRPPDEFRISLPAPLPPSPPPHIRPPVQVQTSSLNSPVSRPSNYTCHHAVPFHAVIEFYSCAYYSRAECTVHEPEGLASVTRHADACTPWVRRADRRTSDVPDGLRRRSGPSCQLCGISPITSRSDYMLIFVGALPQMAS